MSRLNGGQMMKMGLWWWILGVAAISQAAQAQDLQGDPVAGREFAEVHCSGCHEVVPGQPPRGQTKAPSFAAVADDPAVTEIALRAFLQSSHANMPDIRLTHDQATDVIAYLISLRGEQSAP